MQQLTLFTQEPSHARACFCGCGMSVPVSARPCSSVSSLPAAAPAVSPWLNSSPSSSPASPTFQPSNLPDSPLLVTKVPLVTPPPRSSAASSSPASPAFQPSISPPAAPPCPRGQSSSPRPSPGRADCHALLALMANTGTWFTPYEIAQATEIGLLSITARLRNLREPRYGANQVNIRQRPGAPPNTFEYQVITNFNK